jgi:pimeloyl-ACP methyl ester carboxylesterase
MNTPSDAAPWATSVLLLPGLGCDGDLYADLQPALEAAGHACTLSRALEQGDTLEAMADQVVAELDAAPRPGVVIGCSMGGMLALIAAARQPRSLAGLVLIGTSARPDPPEVAGLRHWAAGEFEAGRIDEVLVPNVPLALHPASVQEDTLVERYLRMVRRTGGAALARQNRAVAGRSDLRPLLPRIAVPALLLCGEADGLTPPAHSAEAATLLPWAAVQVVPGAGHLPTLEQPAAVRARVLPWLSRVCARAP